MGKPDRFFDIYVGKVYNKTEEGGALEVMTRSYQMLFGRRQGKEVLNAWLREDPEHVWLTIDTLFNHDFPGGKRR